jgi:hypothetical protein
MTAAVLTAVVLDAEITFNVTSLPTFDSVPEALSIWLAAQ